MLSRHRTHARHSLAAFRHSLYGCGHDEARGPEDRAHGYGNRAPIERATTAGASFAISLAAKDVRLALRDVRTAPVAAATPQLLHAAADQTADVASLINLETR